MPRGTMGHLTSLQMLLCCSYLTLVPKPKPTQRVYAVVLDKPLAGVHTRMLMEVVALNKSTQRHVGGTFAHCKARRKPRILLPKTPMHTIKKKPLLKQPFGVFVDKNGSWGRERRVHMNMLASAKERLRPKHENENYLLIILLAS